MTDQGGAHGVRSTVYGTQLVSVFNQCHQIILKKFNIFRNSLIDSSHCHMYLLLETGHILYNMYMQL